MLWLQISNHQEYDFHKQIALFAHPRIFCFSPNVRIESAERRHSGKHLIEFVQLDLEIREATRSDVISLGEELYRTVIIAVKEKCQKDLEFFGRKLSVPESPFPQISYAEAEAKFGPDFEERLSWSQEGPFWIIDFPIEVREFYDREDENRPELLSIWIFFTLRASEKLFQVVKENISSRGFATAFSKKGFSLRLFLPTLRSPKEAFILQRDSGLVSKD